MHWRARKQIWILQVDTADVVHWRAQNKPGSSRQTHRRGALASTKTDLDPSGRHNRRGALASTKHIGILQTDTQTGALASTGTD